MREGCHYYASMVFMDFVIFIKTHLLLFCPVSDRVNIEQLLSSPLFNSLQVLILLIPKAFHSPTWQDNDGQYQTVTIPQRQREILCQCKWSKRIFLQSPLSLMKEWRTPLPVRQRSFPIWPETLMFCFWVIA